MSVRAPSEMLRCLRINLRNSGAIRERRLFEWLELAGARGQCGLRAIISVSFARWSVANREVTSLMGSISR